MNKKQPNKNVRKAYNDLQNALEEDIYRYNPSDDVLKKRKLKKERREHLLNELERKYDFGEQTKKKVRKAYKNLQNAVEEDIYKYNPNDDVLKKRKLKKERREHLLNELERNYDFGETPKKKVVKNTPTKVKIKNKSISNDSKYIE